MLSLATSHIAHLCNQLNHVALPISIPRFKSIIFYQNSCEIKLFLQKNAKFLSADPQNSPPLRISDYAPERTYGLSSVHKAFKLLEIFVIRIDISRIWVRLKLNVMFASEKVQKNFQNVGLLVTTPNHKKTKLIFKEHLILDRLTY